MMFDPSLKSPPSLIKSQAENILKSDKFSMLLEHTPNVLMILNRHRQVVYLNRNPLATSDVSTETSLGQRPGECLACINISKGELGCGSSEFCKVCGFNAAISASEQGKTGMDECHIALHNGGSLTLSITAQRFRYGEDSFIFCALEDISEKKRRQMLESIFLHDILNTAAILNGLSEAFDDMPDNQIKTMLHDVSVNISDEVQSYRMITNAENQTLKTSFMHVDLSDITEEVVRSLRNIQQFRNREIRISVSGGKVYTERTLLRRILINLLKNALEAGSRDDIVEINAIYDKMRDMATFSVKNTQVIPRDTQLKLFQKSFSTKSRRRGWGTYSIKVLTEKYLKGQVTFISNEKTGTIFTISVPSLKM